MVNHDLIAETRSVICQFGATDDGVVLYAGRQATPDEAMILKQAIATLIEFLQQTVDWRPMLPVS